MMRLVYVLCETLSVIECARHTHDFYPPRPDRCEAVAEELLATLTPEGFGLGQWYCVDPAGEDAKAAAALDPLADGRMP
jgi:hypothetical protein